MLFTILISSFCIFMFFKVMKVHLVQKECGITPIYGFMEILIGAFCIWYGMKYQPYKADINVVDALFIIPMIIKSCAENADRNTGKFIILCGIIIIIFGIIIMISAVVLNMIPHLTKHIIKNRKSVNAALKRTSCYDRSESSGKTHEK